MGKYKIANVHTPIRLFPYFGSKTMLAKYYPKPKHDIIVEPFAGASAYSCLYYEKKVILYEINPIIYDVIKFLIDSTKKEILSLPLLKINETTESLNVPEVIKSLIGFWINHGTIMPMKRFSTWGKHHLKTNPNNQGGFWGERRRWQLSEDVEKIKHWEVYNEDYRCSFNKVSNATWFIDPPYQKKGRCYLNNSKEINYNSLGKECKNLKGQVIVCENYGAEWLPFKKLKSHQGQRKQVKKNTEAIWTK